VQICRRPKSDASVQICARTQLKVSTNTERTFTNLPGTLVRDIRRIVFPFLRMCANKPGARAHPTLSLRLRPEQTRILRARAIAPPVVLILIRSSLPPDPRNEWIRSEAPIRAACEMVKARESDRPGWRPTHRRCDPSFFAAPNPQDSN